MRADLEQTIQETLNLHNDALDTPDNKVYHLLTQSSEDGYAKAALISSTTEGHLTVLVADDGAMLERTLSDMLHDPDIPFLEGLEDSFLLHSDETWQVRLW